MSKFASKTAQYAVYDRTNGTAKYVDDTLSYKRPEIAMLSDELKGAGIMGTIDLPSGMLDSLEGELGLNKANDRAIALFAPVSHKIEVRWGTPVLDSASSTRVIQANKDILTMIPKTLDLGTIESNEANEGTLTYEILTFEHIIDGKSKIKIDKLNNVFIIDGKDYSAALKKAL